MRCISPIYPALGRYFRTAQDMANAGCMSRKRLYECLYGIKEFTANEKVAIANAIVTGIKADEIKVDNKYYEMHKAMVARKDFDRVYRKGGAA